MKKCPFFYDQMAQMPTMVKMMNDRTSLGDKTSCAAYFLAIAGSPEPADLYPNNLEKAYSGKPSLMDLHIR